MQFGQGWDPVDPDHAPVHLERTISEIARHGADLIFLQEVERARPDGHQLQPPPNFTRLRAAFPGYDACFAYPKADPRELPFGLGLAIFSRTALTDVSRADLPSPPIEFEFAGRRTTPTDRVLLRARTRLGQHDLRLLNTHLLAFFMLGATSEENPEQRRCIARELAEVKGPTLLAGDFNVRHHASLTAQFAPHGFSTVQDRQVTWRRQPWVLDHVFYNSPLRCVAHEVVPTLASDHHALVADFELP
jgi:endonuclease/exonuclease/phosphatase (EEP) superfamily protein YafD